MRLPRLFAARTHLWASVLVSVAVYILPLGLPTPELRVALAWDAGAVCFLVLVVRFILDADDKRMRERAIQLDEGSLTTTLLVVVAVAFSIYAVAGVLGTPKGAPGGDPAIRVLAGGATILLSWTFAHTLFATHYAHVWYGDDRATEKLDLAGGLDFPKDEHPDYWDFMYHAFIIGTTCQVSDIDITSKRMRRLALAHGVIAFFLNTVILAMSINVAASMLQG